MKFEKIGKICDSNMFDLSWLKTNIMTPLPIINGDVIRVYLTMCDELNRGQVGYVEVDRNNPLKIVNYSKEKCLDVGEKGMFDEDGVLPTSLYEENEKLYMYYSAYQKQCSVPLIVPYNK